MKKLIMSMLLLFIMVASLALAPGDNMTNDEDEPVACCMAMTADCLACAAGKSINKFCDENPETIGCQREEFNEDKLVLGQEYRAEAQMLKEQLMAEYGNDTEALREAYQERAREMIQEYKGDVNELAKEYKARNTEELNGYIEARKEMFAAEMEAKKEEVKAKVQERMQEENEVKLAVQTMLAMENMAGEMGPQVKAIATEMNNRVEKATELKEEAANKGGFARFFAGGDEETAQGLYQEAKMYQEKIQELKQLKEQANLDEETKAIFEEQIQTMEQEQLRLQKLTAKEDNRGLLGWIWKNKVVDDEGNLVGEASKKQKSIVRDNEMK